MPFTPEALQAVVEILWHDLEDQTAFPGLDAREQEQAFQQGLQQVGAALLQRAWEAHDAPMHARGVRCEVPDCPEQGWRMRRTARRSVHVLTQFGPVRYRRSEYQGRCGHRLYGQWGSGITTPCGSEGVYGAIDGGFVLLRQDAHDPERWREAKRVAWFQEGRPYHAPRPGEDGPPKRARDIQAP